MSSRGESEWPEDECELLIVGVVDKPAPNNPPVEPDEDVVALIGAIARQLAFEPYIKTLSEPVSIRLIAWDWGGHRCFLESHDLPSEWDEARMDRALARAVTRFRLVRWVSTAYQDHEYLTLTDRGWALAESHREMLKSTDDGLRDSPSVEAAGGNPQASETRNDDVQIDRESRVAMWRGEEIRFKPANDYDLFIYLHDRPGRRASYRDLFGRMRPKELSPAVESLDEAPPELKNAISRIRTALKGAGCPWAVVCERGAKYYRLVPPA